MKKKKMITAEELMAELSADPEYQRKLAQDHAKMLDRMARMADACRPILDNLRRIGCDGESIQDIVGRHAPLPDDVVQVLLHWLPLVDDAPVKETIVRAVGAAKSPYAGHALVDCFESTRSESLKFAVANTMAISRPRGVGDWLTEVVRAQVYDRDCLILYFQWLTVFASTPLDRTWGLSHSVFPVVDSFCVNSFGSDLSNSQKS